MKKSMLLATALLAGATAGALVTRGAEAQTLFTPQPATPGFYVGGEGGLNWLLNNNNYNMDLGFAAGGFVGYDFVGPRIELEGVFVQIGLVPNTEFLKGVVDLSKFGEIVVDAKGHTNVHGVFAAGDCTTVPYKQIVIAASEGSKAALSAFDHLIRH